MPLEPKEVDSLQGNQSQTALFERYGLVSVLEYGPLPVELKKLV